MKKIDWAILFSLLISLFIYLFYRTEKTVINKLSASLLSLNDFMHLQKSVSLNFPLEEHLIYSLPEGLWVFCITLTSRPLFVKLGSLRFDLVFLPLIFSIGLEFLQLLHITNGRFDLWDIGFALFFWALARYGLPLNSSKENIFRPFSYRSFLCLFSYAIVYLAHVWK